MLKVLHDAIDGCVAKAGKNNGTLGRVKREDIPEELRDLAKIIVSDMIMQRHGNHFKLSVAYNLPWAGRAANEFFYEDDTMPVMYLEALRVVAEDWNERVIEKSGCLPAETPEIAHLVSRLYSPPEALKMIPEE